MGWLRGDFSTVHPGSGQEFLLLQLPLYRHLKESQLPQGDVGNREPARLPPLLQGLGRVPGEARRSVGPEQRNVGVTEDPHRHSLLHREGTRRWRQARPCRAAPGAMGGPPRQGRAPVRYGQ